MRQATGSPDKTQLGKRPRRVPPAAHATADGKWDLVNGHAAEEIERFNLASQKAVAASLVKFLLAKAELAGARLALMPDEAALGHLHRAGTLFLLKKPGCYRDINIHIAKNGEVVHQPPPWQEVKELMRDFFQRLAVVWAKGDALDVASYALWRITWIHPFRDGNGRTANLFAYACLCVKLGALLPDTSTVVDQILSDHAACEKALRAADRAFARRRGKQHLRSVKAYLDGLLLRQIRSAEPVP